MCGIVGVCGKLLVKEENAFKTLLCLDTIRGPDSTGILGVSGSTGFEIFKKVGTPWNSFSEKGFEKIFKYTNVMLLGHNRAATIGQVTDKNAHPFDVGNIIGVHNGTLRNEHKLLDHEYFDVDSETLLHNFDKRGAVETIKDVDGAFAVVYYDKRDHTIHFLRNKERPLSYAYTKDKKAMFWASERWMLTIACARCGVELEEIKELPEMEERSFKLPTQSSPSKIESLDEMVSTKLFKEEKKYHSDNVIPWRYAGSPVQESTRAATNQNPFSQERYKRMCKFVGQEVKFSVSGAVEGKYQKFIRAYVESEDAFMFEIRIFLDPKNKKYDPLVFGKTPFWKGRVKKINASTPTHGYLLLDNRTIVPADTREAPRITEKSFNKFKGKIVSAQEWLDATNCGCDNCGNIPALREAGDLEWYDDDHFFCKSCFQTQNVQNYLSVLPEE